MIRDFCLMSTDGREYRISRFRGSRNLLLVFSGGAAPSLVGALAQRRAELEGENTKVFVIVQGNTAEAEGRSGFTVLLDSEGVISRRFGADKMPAVYITDQFGEIYSAALASQGNPLPNADEVIASLAHINAACPE